MVKAQQDVVRWLASDGDPECAEVAHAFLDRLEDRATVAGERAMVVLMQTPPGKVSAVLTRYYVMGDSLSGIAAAMGCSYRTVTKAKAKGLAILGRMDESHEQDDSDRQLDT